VSSLSLSVYHHLPNVTGEALFCRLGKKVASTRWLDDLFWAAMGWSFCLSLFPFERSACPPPNQARAGGASQASLDAFHFSPPNQRAPGGGPISQISYIQRYRWGAFLPPRQKSSLHRLVGAVVLGGCHSVLSGCDHERGPFTIQPCRFRDPPARSPGRGRPGDRAGGGGGATSLAVVSTSGLVVIICSSFDQWLPVSALPQRHRSPTFLPLRQKRTVKRQVGCFVVGGNGVVLLFVFLPLHDIGSPAAESGARRRRQSGFSRWIPFLAAESARARRRTHSPISLTSNVTGEALFCRLGKKVASTGDVGLCCVFSLPSSKRASSGRRGAKLVRSPPLIDWSKSPSCVVVDQRHRWGAFLPPRQKSSLHRLVRLSHFSSLSGGNLPGRKGGGITLSRRACHLCLFPSIIICRTSRVRRFFAASAKK